MNYWKESKTNIYVAAHRGWSDKYPENTMPAFEAAIEIGVDQIETDIHMTLDGELILIHDETVNRTTDGLGKVCEKKFAEICTLDAGIKKGEQFKGTKIPTFIELMELVKDHPTMTLDLELKDYPTTPYIGEEKAFEECDRILAIVDEYGYTDRVVLNSWCGKLNEYIAHKYGKKYRQHVYYPSCHMGKLTENPYDYAFCCCMFSAFYDGPMASKMEFERMASFGVEPWAGAGVKDEATVDRAIECGATLITCNNPDVILDILRKKGYHA